MDPEGRRLLEETFALSEENNQMLHQMRNRQRWATFWQTLKILLIIGITLGAFYYVEPYLNKVMELYNAVSGTTQKLNNTGNSLQDLLKKF